MASSDIEMGTGDEISYSKIPVEGRSRTTEEWKSTFVAKVEQSKSPMPNKCCIFFSGECNMQVCSASKS